jgi:hypothetical protein
MQNSTFDFGFVSKNEFKIEVLNDIKPLVQEITKSIKIWRNYETQMATRAHCYKT